jgi:hypothetical protein
LKKIGVTRKSTKEKSRRPDFHLPRKNPEKTLNLDASADPMIPMSVHVCTQLYIQTNGVPAINVDYHIVASVQTRRTSPGGALPSNQGVLNRSFLVGFDSFLFTMRILYFT